MWGLQGGLRTKSEEGEVLCVQGQGAWGWHPGSDGVSVGLDCGFLGLSSSWFEGFLGCAWDSRFCCCFFFFFFFKGCRAFSLILWIFLFLGLGAQGF